MPRTKQKTTEPLTTLDLHLAAVAPAKRHHARKRLLEVLGLDIPEAFGLPAGTTEAARHVLIEGFIAGGGEAVDFRTCQIRRGVRCVTIGRTLGNKAKGQTWDYDEVQPAGMSYGLFLIARRSPVEA